MTLVKISAKDPTKIKADALVLGLIQNSDSVALAAAEHLSKDLQKVVQGAVAGLDLKAKAGEVTKIVLGDAAKAPVAVLVGLGQWPAEAPAAGLDLNNSETETLRRAAGQALRSLAGKQHVVLALPAEADEHLSAVIEGALLGSYRFDKYAEQPAAVETVEVVSDLGRRRTINTLVERAQAYAEAVNGTRDLVNTAPNELFPQSFAEYAQQLVKDQKKSNLKIEVLDDKALRAGGYGGLIGVGQGSANPPRLVKVTYKPRGAKQHVALVGKGITFDTGGISIKPAAGMEAMKSDMAGAAAVLHVAVAAAQLELDVAVTSWLALAENMPSGTAQRPSDVIKIYGGKTVEVLNTDAEGRLVMADALEAAREENPDALIDIATLTGAQIIALGTRVAAVIGDTEVRDEILAAAGVSGELMWPMPMPEELRETLKSKVADLANIGKRPAGTLSAAVFLKEFAGDTPWAHIDIAGPSFNEGGPWGATPVGGTGYGVRTLLDLLEARASAK